MQSQGQRALKDRDICRGTGIFAEGQGIFAEAEKDTHSIGMVQWVKDSQVLT